MKNEKIISNIKTLIEWCNEGINVDSNPYTFHQYMKLREVLESTFESLVSVKVFKENLQQSVSQQENAPRLVVDNTLQNKLLRRQGMILVNLPML